MRHLLFMCKGVWFIGLQFWFIEYPFWFIEKRLVHRVHCLVHRVHCLIHRLSGLVHSLSTLVHRIVILFYSHLFLLPNDHFLWMEGGVCIPFPGTKSFTLGQPSFQMMGSMRRGRRVAPLSSLGLFLSMA